MTLIDSQKSLHVFCSVGVEKRGFQLLTNLRLATRPWVEGGHA